MELKKVAKEEIDQTKLCVEVSEYKEGGKYSYYVAVFSPVLGAVLKHECDEISLRFSGFPYSRRKEVLYAITAATKKLKGEPKTMKKEYYQF
jgi:protoporphyrinogen oxidase